MTVSRREFVRVACGTAAGAAALASAAAARFAVAQTAKSAIDLIDKLAVSTWSFRNRFAKTRDAALASVKPVDAKIVDIVKLVREKLGARYFELCSAHLESFNGEYLQEVRVAVVEAGCEFIHFTDHVRGLNLAGADRKKRDHDLQIYEGLIGVAEQLNIRSMRVDAGRAEGAVDLSVVADAIRRLARFGKERKVEIVLENRPGLTAEPKALVKLAADCGDNVSVCPDWSALPAGEARFTALAAALKPAKRVCAASFRDLDEAGGHREFDLARCCKTLKSAKFAGWIALRYEGGGEPLPQLERMLGKAKEWLK